MQMSFCYECTCNYFRIYAICGLGCLNFFKSLKKTAKICDVWVGRSVYVMSLESLIYSF